MRIEHIVVLSGDEYLAYIKESGAHNKAELKAYLKDKLQITMDFCVRITSLPDFDFCVIDYDESIVVDKEDSDADSN